MPRLLLVMGAGLVVGLLPPNMALSWYANVTCPTGQPTKQTWYMDLKTPTNMRVRQIERTVWYNYSLYVQDVLTINGRPNTTLGDGTPGNDMCAPNTGNKFGTENPFTAA